ncbi:hypothetical protein CP533_2556 [Ophiocordyceps camponoti-saundersi (nom. inval.)]|nr:hypothetical protein CP533_2556 [Ophiocordyceps camponoti-saundersi (nom. inval.)]
MDRLAAQSPGAALLRSSRMFSLPKPLPDPVHHASRMTRATGSPTLTRPHPTHQSIASPPQHRELGDWGFKRPLPRKTTLATSTPFIRVKEVDSRESVTDFHSAADYTMSLEKFHELRVPVCINEIDEDGKSKTSSRLSLKSVFERDIDFTHMKPHQSGSETFDKRWKFSGPWVNRLNEMEFSRYLKNKVRPRRAEFRALLKDLLAQDLTADQNRVARDKGDEPPPPVTVEQITDEQFTEFLRKIRFDRILSFGLTSSFLDMGPLGHPGRSLRDILLPTRGHITSSPYSKMGPPRSHPSAGISYLRTNSFVDNHPLYGPQKEHRPVEARIVFPKVGLSRGKLGVGGFVVNPPDGNSKWNNRRNTSVPQPGINFYDVTKQGGGKYYVAPLLASLDPRGRVVVVVKDPHEEAELIEKERKSGLDLSYRLGTTLDSGSQP